MLGQVGEQVAFLLERLEADVTLIYVVVGYVYVLLQLLRGGEFQIALLTRERV